MTGQNENENYLFIATYLHWQY